MDRDQIIEKWASFLAPVTRFHRHLTTNMLSDFGNTLSCVPRTILAVLLNTHTLASSCVYIFFGQDIKPIILALQDADLTLAPCTRTFWTFWGFGTSKSEEAIPLVPPKWRTNLKPAITAFLPTWKQAVKTTFAYLSWYGWQVSKQLPCHTSSRHRSTLSFIWSRDSGHLVNRSPVFTLLLALFFVSTTSQGKYLAL